MKENIISCLPEAKKFRTTESETVSGALYIHRDFEVEKEIGFLKQFIPSLRTHSVNIFSPYITNVARIEFDPIIITNHHIYTLIQHLSSP
jgi:hypothetical protein